MLSLFGLQETDQDFSSLCSNFSFFQCCTEDKLNESISADALSFGYFLDLGEQVGIKPDKDGVALRFKGRHFLDSYFVFVGAEYLLNRSSSASAKRF